MSMTANQLALARQYLADPGTSAVQTIELSNAIGGTFTISYDGQTTLALDFDAPANDVQNALCALSNVGVGNIQVVLSANVYTVLFTGVLGNIAQAMLTVDATNLDGVGIIATVVETIAGGVTAFTDDDLNALYVDAQSNFYLAICYGFRVLMSNASKFSRYVAGQTQEFKEQIFDHLKILADMYQTWAFAGNQVQFVSLQSVPPRVRAVPNTVGVPATSLQYFPPNPRNPWGVWRNGG